MLISIDKQKLAVICQAIWGLNHGSLDGKLYQLIRMLMGWTIEGPLDLVDTSPMSVFPGVDVAWGCLVSSVFLLKNMAPLWCTRIFQS